MHAPLVAPPAPEVPAVDAPAAPPPAADAPALCAPPLGVPPLDAPPLAVEPALAPPEEVPPGCASAPPAAAALSCPPLEGCPAAAWRPPVELWPPKALLPAALPAWSLSPPPQALKVSVNSRSEAATPNEPQPKNRRGAMTPSVSAEPVSALACQAIAHPLCRQRRKFSRRGVAVNRPGGPGTCAARVRAMLSKM